MKNSKQKTKSNLRNRSNYVRTIAMTGLLIALSVTIGWLCKTYLTFGPIRVTFENIPVIISGIIYGPVVGIVVGVLSDIVSCLTSPNPALNPIIMLGAATIGALSGIIPRYIIKSGEILKVWISVFASHIIGSMIIKSIGLHVFFKYGFELLVWRIPLYVGIAICESIIIYAILKNKNIKKMLGKQIQDKGNAI
ncbi:MAG: folate family ECF transporter S component [Ruminococcaceae bacterium]|nr:folate family ECF transporter S component [Oscillospiraceae bacterium]